MENKKEEYWLLSLFLISIVADFFHFTDNILYLSEYPDPPGITPMGIIRFGLIMAAIGISGYWLYIKQRKKLSFWVFYAYCFMSMVVLGHYLPVSMQKIHGSFTDIPFRIHFFIFLEAITTLTLMAYVVYLHLKTSHSNKET